MKNYNKIYFDIWSYTYVFGNLNFSYQVIKPIN